MDSSVACYLHVVCVGSISTPSYQVWSGAPSLSEVFEGNVSLPHKTVELPPSRECAKAA